MKKMKNKTIGFGKNGNIALVPTAKENDRKIKTSVQELIKLPLPLYKMEMSTDNDLIIYV